MWHGLHDRIIQIIKYFQRTVPHLQMFHCTGMKKVNLWTFFMNLSRAFNGIWIGKYGWSYHVYSYSIHELKCQLYRLTIISEFKWNCNDSYRAPRKDDSRLLKRKRRAGVKIWASLFTPDTKAQVFGDTSKSLTTYSILCRKSYNLLCRYCISAPDNFQSGSDQDDPWPDGPRWPGQLDSVSTLMHVYVPIHCNNIVVRKSGDLWRYVVSLIKRCIKLQNHYIGNRKQDTIISHNFQWQTSNDFMHCSHFFPGRLYCKLSTMYLENLLFCFVLCLLYRDWHWRPYFLDWITCDMKLINT